MAPFGHSTRDPIWTAVDASLFLSQRRQVSAVEAAFAAAFSLPAVSRIAVGTTNPQHLAELQRYRLTEADEAVIWRYRDLLRQKASFGTVHLSQLLPGARA
jgi:pyridoxine 4-dehydrogenase